MEVLAAEEVGALDEKLDEKWEYWIKIGCRRSGSMEWKLDAAVDCKPGFNRIDCKCRSGSMRCSIGNDWAKLNY